MRRDLGAVDDGVNDLSILLLRLIERVTEACQPRFCVGSTLRLRLVIESRGPHCNRRWYCVARPLQRHPKCRMIVLDASEVTHGLEGVKGVLRKKEGGKNPRPFHCS